MGKNAQPTLAASIGHGLTTHTLLQVIGTDVFKNMEEERYNPDIGVHQAAVVARNKENIYRDVH